MKQVVVVGGGVVGLCCAYYALEAGHRVTLIERGSRDHQGCSLGNAGMVVPSHFIPLAAPGMVGMGLRMMLQPDGPFAIQPRLDPKLLDWAWRFHRSANRMHVERAAPVLRDLSLESRRLFTELAALPTGTFGLTQRGLLLLCKTAETLHHESEAAEMAHRLGLEARVVSPTEAQALDPGIRMETAGGVYFPQDCHLSPARLMHALIQLVEGARAEVRWNTEVQSWRTERDRITGVQTGGEVIGGDEFVLAAGVWSGGARGLDLRLPMQSGKGYSITLPHPPEMPEICSILTEARVAVTPMDGALRFAGTMEIGGEDLSVNQRRVDGMIRSIRDFYPAFTPDQFVARPVWSGLRPCTPDGLPYVGRPRAWPNLCVAAGHAMMGVSLAPVTGRLVAEMLDGRAPSIDTRLLSPDRFA